MLLDDTNSLELGQFPGSFSLLDAYSVPATIAALLAQNVEYLPGELHLTRLGHSATAVNSPGAVAAIFNWLYLSGGAEQNVVAYYSPPTGVNTYNLTSSAAALPIPQAGAYGCSMEQEAARLYAAFFNAQGLAEFPGQVFGYAEGADPLFAAPVNFAPAVSQTGSAGLNTIGTRRFGYLLITRNGFIVACPSTGPGAFAPVSFTLTSSNQLSVTITPSGSWPTYVASVQLIMTDTTNLNVWYQVPGASAAVAGSLPVTITASIADSDLDAAGLDASPYLNVYSFNSVGEGFSPSFIFTAGNRMAYLGIDASGFPVIFFSDPDAYQFITLSQHAVYMPGKVRAISGIEYHGVIYIFAKSMTLSVSDNGGYPATWATPQVVDYTIGSPSVYGVTLSSTTGNMWVASERGLFLFQGGAYPVLPVSYYQTADWNRINWGGAPCAQYVIDDVNRKVVRVLAALDGALTPNYAMSWDYTEGIDASSVKYSLDSIPGYPLGATGLVLNPATGIQEQWYGASQAGFLVRKNNGSEANPWRDTSPSGTALAINGVYQTGIMPGVSKASGGVPEIPGSLRRSWQRSTIKDFHGAHFRLNGSGSVTLLVSGLDGRITTTPAASPLSVTSQNGLEYLVRWFLRSEQQSIALSSNILDSHVVLSYIRAYDTDSIPIR